MAEGKSRPAFVGVVENICRECNTRAIGETNMRMNMRRDFCGRVVTAAALAALCCALGTVTAHAQQRAVAFGTEVKGDWSLETGSGVLFSNMRSKTLDGYTLVPASITASLKLDDPSDDEGWRRGYTEFAFRPYGMAVTHGPESRMVGFDFGPRYNFVQPGWRLVPFIGAMVGFGFADTRDYPNPAVPYGLGQDFCFEFTINLGVRYDVNDTWYVRFMAEYVHFSNAGLSEPARLNRAIDAIGPQLSVGCRF